MRRPRTLREERRSIEATGATARSPGRPVSRSPANDHCRLGRGGDEATSDHDRSGRVRRPRGSAWAGPRTTALAPLGSTPGGETSRSKASRAEARSCQRSVGAPDGSPGGVSRRRNLAVRAARSFMRGGARGRDATHDPWCRTEPVRPSYQELGIVNRLPVTIVKRRTVTCLLPSTKNRHYTAAIPL